MMKGLRVMFNVQFFLSQKRDRRTRRRKFGGLPGQPNEDTSFNGSLSYSCGQKSFIVLKTAFAICGTKIFTVMVYVVHLLDRQGYMILTGQTTSTSIANVEKYGGLRRNH